MPRRGAAAPRKPKRKAKDDLTSIEGISPVIADCLHEAGIDSFEDLASMAPEETFAVIGPGFEISSAVVAEPHWVGQASRLSGNSAEVTSPNAPAPQISEAPETITCIVEFLLDADRRVCETRVREGDSHQQAWAGWDPERLLRFFRAVNAELEGATDTRQTLSTPEQAPATAANPEPSAASEQARPPEQQPFSPPGPMVIRMRELEIIPDDGDVPVRIIGRDQTFLARVRVEASGIATDAAGRFSYSVTVGAKLAAGRKLHALAESRGVAVTKPDLEFEMTGNPVPPGLYKLFVILRFGAADPLRSEAGALSVLE